jgi:hypothetical protein
MVATLAVVWAVFMGVSVYRTEDDRFCKNYRTEFLAIQHCISTQQCFITPSDMALRDQFYKRCHKIQP